MVASEALPYAKTGGLADVIGALPASLGRLGHRVTVVLPKYRGVPPGDPRGELAVPLGPRSFPVRLSDHRPSPNVRVLLLDCPELYDRDGLYGLANTDYPDNPVRFAVLARAALDAASLDTDLPSVFHGHDWQAGLLPVFQRTYFRSSPIGRVPTVFTIHNLSYQGMFASHWMPALGLGWDLFTAGGLEFWGTGSFLKGGILFSTLVTTVSARYAREIQTPEFGFGFEGVVASRARDLVGITNGIDISQWDPAHDPHLPAPYDAESLSGKGASKERVLEVFALTRAEARARPLVGLISRLVDQKGFDLLAALGDRLAAVPATFVLLGSGLPLYEAFWRDLAGRHPDRIAARIGFDESLAHLIEAGADIFLMPSRFEPCGLNQMYSLRYGTVPIVRAVGGLDDTVEDYAGPLSQGTGFKFLEYSPNALMGALNRALDVYSRSEEWKALQIRGMQRDHSWDAAARQYVKVYEQAIEAASHPPSTVG